jgi:streptomycin 6-kinase
VDIHIPQDLTDSAARGDIDAAWLETLPALVEESRDRWQLALGGAYRPGGNCSWVAPVERDGEKLVLKVGFRHPEAEQEADGLRAWAGRGAVRLHDSFVTADTIALLLERCEPGTTLGSALPEEEQDEIVADRLQELWIDPPEGHRFRQLSEMTALWTETLERDLSRRGDDVDGALVEEARRIYLEEAQTCPAPKLLCTDLHAANILASEREPWLVIDPKPFVGDPAYDTVQHMLNCIDRLEEDPFALADRMAVLTGTDRDRVRMWLFARSAQESVGDGDWQRRLGPVAARLA